jgi:hypothetical protein
MAIQHELEVIDYDLRRYQPPLPPPPPDHDYVNATPVPAPTPAAAVVAEATKTPQSPRGVVLSAAATVATPSTVSAADPSSRKSVDASSSSAVHKSEGGSEEAGGSGTPSANSGWATAFKPDRVNRKWRETSPSLRPGLMGASKTDLKDTSA